LFCVKTKNGIVTGSSSVLKQGQTGHSTVHVLIVNKCMVSMGQRILNFREWKPRSSVERSHKYQNCKPSLSLDRDFVTICSNHNAHCCIIYKLLTTAFMKHL